MGKIADELRQHSEDIERAVIQIIEILHDLRNVSDDTDVSYTMVETVLGNVNGVIIGAHEPDIRMEMAMRLQQLTTLSTEMHAAEMDAAGRPNGEVH